MTTASHRPLLVFVAAIAFAPAALAQQQFVYPSKGQSAQQQKDDEHHCHEWAVQHSGFDPARPPPAPAPQHAAARPPTTLSGVTPGAGVRGAVRGAIVGEIVGDDASAGAVAGAVAARGQSRRQNAATARQQQAAAEQQQKAAAQQVQQKQATYARARAACLEGRGYTVR